MSPADAPRRGGIAGPWAILALSVAATAINLMDRQLPFILTEPIKHDFKLTDTQFGLLGGFAFSAVYAVGALPLARIADHGSRRLLLAASMVMWSLGTALGGVSRSFLQLMGARAGVALGEAGAAPTSHALIADLFPAERRGFAMAAHTAGIPVGVMLGLGLGGVLLEHMSWRQVLLVASVPGLVLAAICVLFVREPPRVGAHRAAHAPPVGDAVMILWRQRSFVWLTIAATFSILATSGGATFGPSDFIRNLGLRPSQAGLLFGGAMGIGGAVGGLVAGALCDRLVRKDARWMLWIPAIGALLQAPLYVASWMTPDLRIAAPVLLLAWTVGASYLPLSYAATQAIAAPRMRAFSSAMIQLVLNLIGNVLGPLSTGYLSDLLRPSFGTRSLSIALAAGAVFLLLSAACFFRAAAKTRQDLQDAARLAQTPAQLADAMLIDEEVRA
jgi:predicted MFS family arabinose efflux permease